MPVTPDYQSAADARAERGGVSSSGRDWPTTLAFLASGATILKALLVSDGILDDEKTVLVAMLLLTPGLLVSSVVVNVRRRRSGALVMNVLSLFLLAIAVLLAVRGWR